MDRDRTGWSSPALAWLLAALLSSAAACEQRTVDARDERESATQSAPVPLPLPEESDARWVVLASLGYFGADGRRAAALRRDELPAPRYGEELIGSQARPWHLTDWVNSPALTLESLRGRVVVIRFWTAPGCPFCEKSMPALQLLADEFRDQPVTFIGAFHGKPATPRPDMDQPVAIATNTWQVRFALAFDREWQTLRSWWLESGVSRRASSVTFVVDKRGVIAHIHPGPVFHPSEDPALADENRDFLALRAAIERALSE